MKCLCGRHAPERAPPLLSAAAACLCLPARNVDARRFPLALLCSPRTHLLLPLAPPRALSLPLALAIGMAEPELELLLLLASAGQGQGWAWPWLAVARPPDASYCHRPLSGGSEAGRQRPCPLQGRDLGLEYETTQGSRCEPQTHMNSAFGLRLIRGKLRVPGAKSFSFILCFCRFLV